MQVFILIDPPGMRNRSERETFTVVRHLPFPGSRVTSWVWSRERFGAVEIRVEWRKEGREIRELQPISHVRDIGCVSRGREVSPAISADPTLEKDLSIRKFYVARKMDI